MKWAKEREAFGHRIADFGLIKEKLGEMAVRIYAAESMCYRTAGMIDDAWRVSIRVRPRPASKS